MQLNVLFIGMEKSEYFRQHQAQSSVSEGSLGKAGKLSIYATFVEESVTIDQRCLRIALWNPSGQENYENLRKISLQTVDCIIFAFSVRMQADLKLLKSYLSQVRNNEQTKSIKIFLLPKQYSNSLELQAALDGVGLSLADDEHTLLLAQEGDFLQRVGRNFLQQKDRARKRQSRGCSCEIY